MQRKVFKFLKGVIKLNRHCTTQKLRVESSAKKVFSRIDRLCKTVTYCRFHRLLLKTLTKKCCGNLCVT